MNQLFWRKMTKYEGTLPKFVKCLTTEAVFRRCSVRKDVLRNFAKFTRKHLCQSLFFNKVACMGP